MTQSVTQFRTSYRVRRYNVVALAFVLCAWLVAAEMHLHLNDQHAGTVHSTVCDYCVALSAGAAPAPQHNIPSVIVATGMVVSFDDMPVHDQTAPSFYLSRGPPAA